MSKRLLISSNDFGLFDAELNSYEYEYFTKHTGAFKRFMQEEPKEQRQLFLDAFCEYSYNHIEITAVSHTSDPKKKFIESFKSYAQETFINGKFSAAKQFLNDSLMVARNRHMIQYMDSHSYAKDPFFHKETRDVFRRLFGEPTEAGTCVKVICVLPLYIRFAGSVCRYLKRWLDMEESLYPIPVKSKSKKDKKAMKELAAAIASAKTVERKAMATNTKTVSNGHCSKPAVGTSKEGPSVEQSTAVPVKKPKDLVEQDGEDISSFCYDMHERKKRKREVQRKGRKHEIACQHPCHGKICNCSGHKAHSHNEGYSHGGGCLHGGAHDHKVCGHAQDHACHGQTYAEPIACQHPCHGKVCSCHDAKEHAEQPACVAPEKQQQLMSCLCTKHKEMAEAKIAEKKAVLEKQEAETAGLKTPNDENLKGKSSEAEVPEGKISEGLISADRVSEAVSSEFKDSETNKSEVKSFECKISEGVTFERKSSEGKISEGNISTSNSCTRDKSMGSEINHVDRKAVEATVGDIEGAGNVSSEMPDVKSERDQAFVRKTFPELHLGKPHPNEQYAQMMAKKETLDSDKEARAKLSVEERANKLSEQVAAVVEAMNMIGVMTVAEDTPKMAMKKSQEITVEKMSHENATSDKVLDDEKNILNDTGKHVLENSKTSGFTSMIARGSSTKMNDSETSGGTASLENSLHASSGKAATDNTASRVSEEEKVNLGLAEEKTEFVAKVHEQLKESKLHTCAFCKQQETEVKTFKKCQKCKGKGTKFYCSRDCQKKDWKTHRLEH